MPAPIAALVTEATAAAARTAGRSLTAGASATVLLAENIVNVHDPTDIALCGLNTRSMLTNRSGRPRSAVRSAADNGPPAAAIHFASRASVPSVRVQSATVPMIAAAPAA